MRVLANFLTVALGLLLLVGCGGGGSDGSGGRNFNVRCTNPNAVLPSMQDALSFFPQTLIDEQHLFINQMVTFVPISDIEGYKQLLRDAGFGLNTGAGDQRILYEGQFIDDKYYPLVYIDMEDNLVSWQLTIAVINDIPTATEIDESIFDNTTIFPPTGTKKIEISLDKGYNTGIGDKMDAYIEELKGAGFEYYNKDPEWNLYEKLSDDGCLLYGWANYNESDRAEWRVWLMTE
jgi:hypothetical protein